MEDLVSLARILVGLSMMSIGAAILFALTKIRPQSFKINILFGLFFITAGLAQIMHIPQGDSVYQRLADTLDLCAGVIAVVTSVVIWPIALKAMRMPSYRDVVEGNDKLLSIQRLFESFMNHIPALATIRDRAGRLRYVNRAWEQTVGIEKDSALGRVDLDWLMADKQVEETDMEVLFKQGHSLEFTTSVTMPDGKQRTWFVISFPVRGETEELIGTIAVDMAAQIAHDKIQAEMAALVQSSQDAIIGLDLRGLITSWNDGACRLFGYKPEEIVGQPISRIVPSLSAEHDSSFIRSTLNRAPDQQVLSKNGEPVHVAITLSPITGKHGEDIGASLIVRDISHWLEVQERIQELNAELTSRVAELDESNKALQQARDDALLASNLKSAFVANISHELRTPLTGIIGMNELLLDSGLTPEQKSMAQIVHDSAQVLMAVVNDILDLAKIEAGKMTLDYKPFNPAFLVHDCAKLLAAAAASKQLQLEVNIEPELPRFVYGDISRVKQVLLNLIGNAIKFTDTGTITVIAELKQHDEEQAIIMFSVIDTGIGISEDQQRFLFTPFSQVDQSSTRRHGGTGLGLAISKRLVELMQGNIGFSSKKNQGSVFWFDVPFPLRACDTENDSSQPPPRRVEPIQQHKKERKVLLVEDNVVLVELALRQLNLLGIKADAVTTGQEAIERALSGKYDIVLMDVNLPDITGNEAARVIRTTEYNLKRKRVPIIAMTAGAMKGDRERALEAGMDDYLPKPVNLEQLKQALERALAIGDQPQLPGFKPPAPVDNPYGII